ncbi:28S ribosomal protein S36, mitochondrial-like isoform X2 [Strongylocentrotus purpuratus]|uniref:28S ribosomal protein S36, mitochondrial n=1 Tax=Strongylocentrotus purpuratus TaxID=7668 RepID=A0A7M7G0F5_STRPU|nr:28S ribosomal protein S36, mitochondrial-like isoform X2 [Strongylocentrotus purpuratus]|eukprot:XP_001199436.1 PREDICTED: 28S ribosomal protein S36, mitochondrial-like isoform X2 [Strongylocentrotus purpuratus]
MSANRVVQAIRPHIPLIKFRAGGGIRRVIPAGAVTATPHPNSTSSLKPPSTRRSDAPEFFQLHPKYHRTILTQEEMEYINRGGPD